MNRENRIHDQVGLVAAGPPVDRAGHEHHRISLNRRAHLRVVFRPADRADEAVHIFQVKHRVAGVGGALPRLLDVGELDRGHEPPDHHLALGRCTGEVGGAMRPHSREDFLKLGQRMAMHVVAKHLLLKRPHLGIRERRHIRQRGRRRLRGRGVVGIKERLLATLAVGQLRGPSRHRLLNAGENRPAMAVAQQAVETAGLGQVFNRRLVDD